MTEVDEKPLSAAQRILLSELIRRGIHQIHVGYMPAKVLVKRGFAEWKTPEICKYSHLAATDVGRSFYQRTGTRTA